MKINIQNLVFQLIPLHKRFRVRYGWLSGLLKPLMNLWDEFSQWRTDIRLLVNVNSQKKVLAGFLYKKLGAEVKIETFNDALLQIPLSHENENTFPFFAFLNEDLSQFPQEKAEQYYSKVPLQGEKREEFEDTDFMVYIPATVNKDEVEAYVEKYRQALVRYKIVQQ